MAVLFLAAAKIVCGLGVWAATAAWRLESPNLFPDWLYLLQLAVFSTASGLLLIGGRSDGRAGALGTSLLLFGSLFVDPLLRHAMPGVPREWSGFASAVLALEPVALSPAYFWRFARQFPRTVTQRHWLIAPRTVFIICVAIGCVLLAGNLAFPFSPEGSWQNRVAGWLSAGTGGHLWDVLIVLTLPALALIFVNVRASPPVERRRVRLLLAGFIAGNLPLILDLLLVWFVPPYREASRSPERIRYLGILFSLGLMFAPIATVYAVLVDRVFDVHFFIRKALQYALARYTLLGLLAIPGIALVWYVYVNRSRPLGELLGAQPATGWLLLFATAAALTIVRRPLLDLLDRRFFREEYDARRVLMELMEGSRRASSVGDQAALTAREIDRALHVNTVSVLLRDAAQEAFVDPQNELEQLPWATGVASLMGRGAVPLDVTFDGGALSRLPDIDQDWLVRSRARLLVPMVASDETLLGVIVIGEKMSEAPFSAEDRELLMSVAASASLALEHRLLLEGTRPGVMTTSEPQPEGDPAQQCSSCGTIQQGGHERCRRCEGALMPARLPAVLAGTFAVECEIGHGGMGVVYRGRDLKLDRLVALKTLPRVSVSSVSRLRQEALAMAALQDPHLAVIYGAEQWRGSPVLILEYLAGGTLGDRLRIGSLTADDVIELGLAMSGALHTLHRAGFLHRDVKPSNIGYTSSGVPKLLDFGLAKLVTGVAGLLATTSASTRTTRLDESIEEVEVRPALTQSRHLAGTLAYMSPEAIALSPPVASFDLWGLAVTLLEALTGRNPFLGGDLEETFHLIRLAHVPDLQSFESPGLTRFFATALSARRDERPRSARAFRDALARCRNV